MKKTKENNTETQSVHPNKIGIKEGMGYMLGASVTGDAHKIAAKCLENGLLILTAKDRLRLLPALSISDAEIDAGLEILKKVME